MQKLLRGAERSSGQGEATTRTSANRWGSPLNAQATPGCGENQRARGSHYEDFCKSVGIPAECPSYSGVRRESAGKGKPLRGLLQIGGDPR
ncbi:hypothetical protein WP50_31020 [Lactiplantibacillus plantarum]|nr:hypothetical protein WP50_31020 [Lactiplantibacillus plantarum]